MQCRNKLNIQEDATNDVRSVLTDIVLLKRKKMDDLELTIELCSTTDIV